MASIAQVFANTYSPDQATRQAAEAHLTQLAESNFASYVTALSSALADASNPPEVRNAIGLALKNTLSARDSATAESLAQRWTGLGDDVRNKVKSDAVGTLASEDLKARNSAGQVIAAVANIELPRGLWNTLMSDLIALVNGRDATTAVRQGGLQTIGYVCETINPEILESQSNEILTAVVQGARKEEPSPEVQHAAIVALFNSLEFVRQNFDREGERNYIMQVVCEATQSANADVQVTAFECLVKIMQLYYDKMRFYMERALFGLTVLGMKHTDERVALQAVEFWSTVCDEEIEIAIDADEALEFGETPARESQHFARTALPEVLPALLTLLPQKDDAADDDEWNISMAAGTCLALLAQCVGDTIVTPIIPYVEAHIKAPEWKLREAAVMAFGSILDGPDGKLLVPLTTQALPTLIEMMADPDERVKDTTAWTLGRISDVIVQTIDPDVHLQPLIAALIGGLRETPKIVSNCCWALMNLAEQLGDPDASTCPLSPFYPNVIDGLISYTDAQTDNESNGRTSAYEAISAFISHSPQDVLPGISGLSLRIIGLSEEHLSRYNQLVGIDQQNNYEELQSNLLGVTTAVIRRLGPEVKPLGDRIMTLLLRLMDTSGKKSPIYEDALLSVGALTASLESDFTPYMEAFAPFLKGALEAHEDERLCTIAVGLVGDVSRALGEATAPVANDFMNTLFVNLQSPTLHRSVKPPILSALGDVALALAGGFEPYLKATIEVLHQAGSMRADPSNADLVLYVNQLREGILEAYVGIVGGLKAGGKIELLANDGLQSIFTFLHVALTDQDRTDATIKPAIGLIGDLAEAFPNGQIKDALQQSWIQDALKFGRIRLGADGKKVAKWAREMVRRATQQQ